MIIAIEICTFTCGKNSCVIEVKSYFTPSISSKNSSQVNNQVTHILLGAFKRLNLQNLLVSKFAKFSLYHNFNLNIWAAVQGKKCLPSNQFLIFIWYDIFRKISCLRLHFKISVFNDSCWKKPSSTWELTDRSIQIISDRVHCCILAAYQSFSSINDTSSFWIKNALIFYI